MERNKSTTLTQDQLVAALHKLGYTDVTKRRIATWRAAALLPPFDIIGGGRGQRRGRESSAWSNGSEVLKQAVQVYELLKVFERFDELYLPLWMLNYPIPLERVRAALSSPLDAAVRDAAIEVDGRSAVEDMIDDAAHYFSGLLQRANMKLFEFPPEVGAAFTNIIMNNNYNLEDQPFQDGVEALERWDKELTEAFIGIFGDEVADTAAVRTSTNSMWTLFTHAQFFNQHLAVQHLNQALDECTDEDLMTVQRDLQIGHQVVCQLKRLITLLTPYIPKELQPKTTSQLVTIFNVGKVCTWVDLALRSHGYGGMIDSVLLSILRGIEEEFTEEAEREIAAAGPHLTVAIESLFEHIGIPLKG